MSAVSALFWHADGTGEFGSTDVGWPKRVEFWGRPECEVADFHSGERRMTTVELKPDAGILIFEMDPGVVA
jgi:hypothetical protein